jgi:hypothetical protein
LNGGGGASVDTGSLVTTASFNQLTASYYAASASFSSSISLLNNATSSYVLASQTSSMTVLSSSLASTASYVQLAQSASYALYAVSASYEINYETSSSYAETASVAINALTASYVLPLTQNVIITGSLNISGSTTQIGTNNLLGQTNLSGSIYVSGSMNALADLTLAGTLRLDPAQDPGNTNETASFLFTSASNTEQGYDLYYRQDGNLVKFKWLEGGISSGLLYGGVISASGATIFVSSGSGILLDPNASFSKEINPIFTYVTWPNYSAPATYLTSSQNTYIYVDAAGTIHQQTGFFDQTQYEQAIPLGRVTHPNYATITGIGSNVQTTYDSDNQQSTFIRAFGPLKIDGFSINAHPGTLGFGIGSGVAYTLGGFYSQDPNSPSHYHGNAFATSSIARAYRSGSGVRLDNNGGAFYSTVDPDYWDDGTGVLNTMASGDWQIQRVFANPVTGRVVVYYGQNTYTTLINALQYLTTDSFTEGEFTAHSLIFVGYLVLKGQTNNLTDTNNNRIINAGIFRNIAGGSSGGGAVAQTLNDLGDVTITTPTNGQALVYNSGTWENGTPVLASTASYVLQAVSASYATSALSSSYALSSSFAPSTPAFPFTGSALITGSLGVTGSLSTRAQGALSTDIAFRVRNSADTANILSVNGDGTQTWFRPANNALSTIKSDTYNLIQWSNEAFGNIAIGYITGSSNLFTPTDGYNTLIGAANVVSSSISGVVRVGYAGSTSANYAINIGHGGRSSGVNSIRIGFHTGASSFGGTNSIHIGTTPSGNDILADNVFMTYFNSQNPSTLSRVNGSFGLLGQQSTILSNGVGLYGVDTHMGNGGNTLVVATHPSPPSSSITTAFQLYASTGSLSGNVRPHFRTSNGTIVWLGDESRLFNVTASRTIISSSQNTISGSSLTVYGSGSAQPVFTVQGSQGELFSITDSLSGSLFSVNDISGLPILEVFSDNTTLIGDYQDPMLITTRKVVMTNSGSFTVYSLPTASYDTAFYDYSIRSGSNARAGQIMAIQSGSSVNFTETTTTDFGNTTAVSFTVIVSGSNMVLTGSAATGSWTTKCIIRGL